MGKCSDIQIVASHCYYTDDSAYSRLYLNFIWALLKLEHFPSRLSLMLSHDSRGLVFFGRQSNEGGSGAGQYLESTLMVTI